MSDPSKCPDCGGDSVLIAIREGDDSEFMVACNDDNDDNDCEYAVYSKTQAQAIAHHERLAGKCRWRKEFPDEQCYWWWIADEESGPMVVNFFWSGTTNSYFATQGQLGWKECREQEWFEKHYPTSRWMKVEEPARPDFGQDVEEVLCELGAWGE